MSGCRIFLENGREKYAPGDKIEGRVECSFNEPKKIRGIEIRLTCKEHNDWWVTQSYYDSSSKRTKTRQVHHSGDQVIHRLVQSLYATNSGEVVMPQGKHVFPFDFIIPRDSPSTYDGPYGYVGFRLKAVVDRPWKSDYEDLQSFRVISLIDINDFPREELEPHNYSDQKTVCCWCCAGGEITMDVNLPSLAFIRGQTIPFQITITNLSNVSVNKVSSSLTKTLKFSVDRPSWKSKQSDEPILTFSEHGVGAHGEFTYNLEMKIPDHIEVPNFNKCKYFECFYKFKVEAAMDGCTINLDLSMYPNVGHFSSISPSRLLHVIDRPPEPGFVPSFNPPPYPADDNGAGPPPSYAGVTKVPPYPLNPGFVLPSAPITHANAPPFSSGPQAAASAPPPYVQVQKGKPPYPLD